MTDPMRRLRSFEAYSGRPLSYDEMSPAQRRKWTWVSEYLEPMMQNMGEGIENVWYMVYTHINDPEWLEEYIVITDIERCETVGWIPVTADSRQGILIDVVRHMQT